MSREQSLNEATLARDSLRRLGQDDGLLQRVAGVLELVGLSSIGLGEVLQDYARQTQAQLRDVIKMARSVAGGMETPDDLKILEQAPFIMKTVKSVLEMTPNAMQRNKAGTLGEKQTVSREQVVELAHMFGESLDITRLIAAEETGRSFASLFAGKELVPAGDDTPVGAAAGRH